MSPVRSPFNAPARWLRTLPVVELARRYRDKCGLDITPWLQGLDTLTLHECEATGMRFWRPERAAGDEGFYRALSAAWPGYYRPQRWEYDSVRGWLGTQDRVLEVGCGQGWFLKSLQGRVAGAVGRELNREAIAGTVTSFPVRAEHVGAHAAALPHAYAAVCSFHVLEHVAEPASFMRDCLAALRPGGLLILSTPNHAAPKFRDGTDPFDMPPHHLNHFDAASFRRIAAALGLQVHAVRQQPRYFEPAAPAGGAPLRPWQRLLGRLVSAGYRLRGAPGDSIVVALRK
jgi:SAM-dependent methyltransferase